MVMWCMGSTYGKSSLRCIYSSQPINVCQDSVLYMHVLGEIEVGGTILRLSRCGNPPPQTGSSMKIPLAATLEVSLEPRLSVPDFVSQLPRYLEDMDLFLQQTASLVWMISWKKYLQIIALFPGLPIVWSLIDCSILQAIKKLNGSWEGLEMRLHKKSASFVRCAGVNGI